MEEHGVHRPLGQPGLASIPLDRGGRSGRSGTRRSGGDPRGAPAYASHPGGGPPEESPFPDLRGGPRSSWFFLHGSPECDWPSERPRGLPPEGPGKTRTHPFGKGSPPPLVLPERRRVSVARPALEPASEIGSREGGDGTRHRHSGTRSELGPSPRRGRIQRQGDGSGGTSAHGADRSKSPLLPIGGERHGIIGLARETSLGGSRNLSGGGRSTDEGGWLFVRPFPLGLFFEPSFPANAIGGQADTFFEPDLRRLMPFNRRPLPRWLGCMRSTPSGSRASSFGSGFSAAS